MDRPVRGSSRPNDSTSPHNHPQVILAPLPPRETHQQAVANYDLYESDYPSQSPHPMASSSAPAWPGHPARTNTNGSLSSSTHHEDDVKVPVSSSNNNDLNFNLGALSLDDNDTTGGGDLTSLPLRFSDPEPQKPVERTGYADDTRYSTGSDHASANGASTSPSVSNAFEPGVVLPNAEALSPQQRVGSMDSTHSTVRAYAAANPNAATYQESSASSSQAGTPGDHPVHPGPPGGYAGQQGYGPGGGQDYGYGSEYYPQQQQYQQPHYRGPPGQPYGQDAMYQQQQYGAGYDGYQQQGYDQYGQPYAADYGQDGYYNGGYQGQGANGYGYGGPGYRPQGPGYGPPRPYYGGGPPGPGGANLHASPSMRGPPPGRGGPRPPMGPGGPPPYGARPPHRGDSGSSMNGMGRGGGGPVPTQGGGAPRKRPLTIELLDEMRQRARTSNDPAAQLEYAKALIEAAVTFGNDDPDPKRQKKNKEALFMEGLKIIKRLATTGMSIGKPAYPDAQFFLANCYGNGSLGLQIDHDKAFNLYMQASKQNHAAATYRTAVCYELGAGTKRDHSRAVQFYRKAASLGDTAAMYKLGMVILKGLLGQQPNPREAITWLKRAAANADEDNPHALHELGLCFEKTGIPTVIPDEAYSRELFTQAAGYGYAPSQFKLGHCYEYGTLTCPVDPRRSIAWYTRAAEQGDAESELGLSGWYLTGSEGVLKQSDTEAYLWARKAADKGLARAEYAVGYYSEVGIGVKQDLEEARRWYLRSAAQGNGRAKKRLTDMKKLGAQRRVRPERGRQNGAGPGPEDENCKVM
ncbi:hypothetical protein BGZ83_005716 [Gryganskiella cystojenkinii]|nr:hypothetical protein BGZ83_005716 [Gryganskiella cystojenkinii]